MKIFSGNPNSLLAKSICQNLNINLGDIYFNTFPSGEQYVQFKENIRGKDVFLLKADSMPVNDSLVQLLIMSDAARRASAERITAILPLCFYQRQDRKDKPRVPISAKLIMNLLEASGVNRIMTMDLHAQQIQGFTDLPFDHLYFRPSLAEAIKNKNIDVIVAPDIGGIKKATEYADKQKLDIAIVVKKRKSDTEVEVTQFIGDVNNKNVIILDDLTESAGTLINAAECCKKKGAKKVYCAVTHGSLTLLGSQRLQEAFENEIVDQFYCSNTVTGEWTGNEWATIIDVGDVFAKAILGIHNNNSITGLFE